MQPGAIQLVGCSSAKMEAVSRAGWLPLVCQACRTVRVCVCVCVCVCVVWPPREV